jgi:hypothetical protein
MGNETLYIVGNGFDLHHGLKTSFSDFGKYVKYNQSELSYYLETYFHYEDLWSDFENVLSTFDISEFFNDNEDLYPDEENDRTGDIHVLEAVAEHAIETLIIGLRNSLRDYLLQIQHTSKSVLNLDKNATFLTFNYTNTLERIYKIEPKRITYLHNKANSEKRSLRPDENGYLADDSDIIIGHAVKDTVIPMPRSDREGIKSAIAYEEAFDTLQLYYKESFKNTKQIISKNSLFFENISHIEKIIIIGHSLSDIDMPYFQEISKRAINVKEWIITHHGKDELSKINEQAFKFLPKDSNVRFLDSENKLLL